MHSNQVHLKSLRLMRVQAPSLHRLQIRQHLFRVRLFWPRLNHLLLNRLLCDRARLNQPLLIPGTVK